MSLIEKLAYKVIHTKKSQYDNPYNYVTNQCSWISLDLCNQLNNNKDSIEKIYLNCLESGSKKREKMLKKNNKVEGENIDELNLNINIKKTIYGNKYHLNQLVILGLSNLILKEHIKEYNINELLNDIKNLNNNSIIINRDGKTFVIHKRNNEYIIFDSHYRYIGFFSFENIFNYIIENNFDGFFIILWAII